MPDSPDLLITEPGKKIFLLLEKIISIENDPTTRGFGFSGGFSSYFGIQYT